MQDAPPAAARIPRLSLGAIWAALPALLTAIYVWTAVGFPVDFWHRICSGRLMWRSGALVCHDTFTHTIAGREILNQNWLAELGMFGLFRLGGFPLVQFAVGLCYAAAVAAITYVAWHRCRSARIAAAMGLVALALAASNMGVRTQAFSAVLFAVELLALWRWPGRWFSVGIVALAELLWTNTHGTFPLGVVLPGAFLLGTAWRWCRQGGLRAMWGDRTFRCYLVCTLATFAAMFANPHPGKTMSYVLGVASKASERRIEEWAPTGLTSYAGIAFVVSVVAVLAVVALRRRRLDPVEVLLLLTFAMLAVRAQRMVIWWAWAMPTAIAPQVAAVLARPARSPASPERATALNFVVLLLLFAMALMSTPWTRRYNPLLPTAKRQAQPADEPRAVVEFLEQHDHRGPIFNPMEWGGYLSWHLDPKLKVFIDPRIDFFPDKVWDDYVRIGRAAPGWEATLALREVNVVVWNRRLGDALPAALRRSHRWENVYRDELSAVFVRSK